MRKFGLASLILLITVTAAYSQITYPLALKVAWDAQPVENITNYTVRLDSITVASPTPAAICDNVVCTQPFNVPDGNNHTICVNSTNMYGTSADTCVIFAARAPGKSTNIKIFR